METALFDGEYFIQKIQWEGLQAPNPVDVMSFGGKLFRRGPEIAEGRRAKIPIRYRLSVRWNFRDVDGFRMRTG